MRQTGIRSMDRFMQASGLRDPFAIDPQIAKRNLTPESRGKKFVLEFARRDTQKLEVLAQWYQRIGRIQQSARQVSTTKNAADRASRCRHDVRDRSQGAGSSES
jgi:poly(3-hydroxybutyrate) depolymerase